MTLTYIDGRGKAVHLIKPSSKHKRRREEMDEVKEEEEMLNKDKQRYLETVKKLRKEQRSIDDKLMNV